MGKTACGSTLYVSPETRMLKNKEYDAKKADIYSMGICLYEMLHGFRPFEGDYELQSKELLLRQLNCQFHINKRLHLSPECRELIKKLLKPDAKQRPSAKMVLDHAWFRSLKENTNQV